MKVELQKAGKRYKLEWVFRQLSTSFEPDTSYAIKGPNGSGKSTLLRMLAGHLSPSEGKVLFYQQGKKLSNSDVYRHLAIAAPYIDLIESLTLEEAIDFHQKFKPFYSGIDRAYLLDRLAFSKSTAKKQLRNFSSGMQQRLKLVLAICSATPYLLMDEPTTNLDEQGVRWYRDLIMEFRSDRLLIIASNVGPDFDFCEQSLRITDYKKKRSRNRG